MVTIRLHNSATRKKEEFVPLDPSNVRMYVCGPTVYDRAHIGNARPVIVFDVLYRLLRHVYGAEHVTYVRNFTDVDDKINAEAQRRQAAGAPGTLEELIRVRTEETIRWYHEDMDALRALRPDQEPRATEFIGAMIGMIEGLIASGHAYAKDGHVLFRVRSYKDYGALSGRSVDDMIAGARVEVAPFKEDPMDFVLWKPSDASLPGWDSPWGRGRPGWHIECSAMSYELLGESFDIHGGGIDLQFPHHENEIAQSACAHPHGAFARYWLHNEMLQVEGKKMSKSLGNFFTVRDLLEQGVSGEVIRYVYLGTHYSKPMDWTRRKALDAKIALDEMARMLGARGRDDLLTLEPGRPLPEVVDALADDLNTHAALSLLRRRNYADRYSAAQRLEGLEDLYASQLLLGFDLKSRSEAVTGADDTDQLRKIVHDSTLLSRAESLAERLDQARADRNFAEADRMRGLLQSVGLIVKSGKDRTELSPGPDFDPAKLEALL